MKIENVCVIGAGVMGSGIAAQIANSGTKVLLLDVASNNEDRSSVARGAVNKMHSTKPAPLSHPKRAESVEVGNLDDDLGKIRNCQLIIEVIVEKLEIKQDLYSKLLPHLSKNAILTSNTSTLQLSLLKEKLPLELASRFMITHFFNPPRYMRLLELITDQTTDLKATHDLSEFIIRRLGKSIVRCNDTPGFIANRIGCFLLEIVLRKTIEYKLDVATVDNLLTEKMSLPSTGIFGLYDLIGLDVMSLIAKSLINSLPENDRFRQMYTEVPLILKMIKEGYTGRKGLGGFYRMRINGANKIKEVIDLVSGEYKAVPTEFSQNCDKAIEEIMSEFEAYVRSLIPEVTDKSEDIDRAMKLGYSWKYGPFELFDGDKKTSNVTLIELQKNSNEFLIFDIGTKMNCLTEDVFCRLIEAVQKAEAIQKPLYIYSNVPYFSAGADLKFLLQKIQDKKWKELENYLKLGQKAMMQLKNASVPVIACARGVALGGGCELLLHCHFVVANQQLNAGLVEASLGLIPAFGGTKEMILRSQGNWELLERMLENIIAQNKSSSADSFSESYRVPLYVNMNEDYLFEDAVEFHEQHTNVEWNGQEVQNTKEPDEQTQLTIKKLNLFKGEITNEDDLLTLEREVFMELIKMPIVEERIAKIVK